jgi:hypothetical protein
MNTWEAIFRQSPVNDGYYDEHKLPHLRWQWPRATWLQARRAYLREHPLAGAGDAKKSWKN